MKEERKTKDGVLARIVKRVSDVLSNIDYYIWSVVSTVFICLLLPFMFIVASILGLFFRKELEEREIKGTEILGATLILITLLFGLDVALLYKAHSMQ